MRRSKGSHRIVVGDVEYRWRANGDDGYILVSIWPTNHVGPFIQGNFKYHETWRDTGFGHSSSAGDQIIVTNRIVRRIIEHATVEYQYDPQVKAKELNLKALDEVIQWDDAIRGLTYD